MVSKCGKFVITFNGELYNFIEIRSFLKQKGFKFRGEGDTEVVLCAYQYREPVV